MSVPAEHLAELLAYAESVLRESLDYFIDTGDVPGNVDLGSVSGPGSANLSHRRSGVSIQPLTAEEAAVDGAWHGYWRQHDYSTTDEALMREAPARPLGRHGPTYTLSWDRARALLRSRRDERRGETDSGQLDLLGSVGA